MRNRADRHRARQRRKRQGIEERRKRNRPGRWETRAGSEDVRNGDERFRARVRGSRERAVPVRGEDERFNPTKPEPSCESARGESGGGKI